jgi:adenosylcobyric acid synthase
MAARTLMIQGTGSDVGKSVLVSALCRLFVRRGMRVAPFKAQNMSNNSFVTPDGKEIGRAQAVQAAACRLPPRADFNPVLIKPSDECSAQLVLNGRVAGSLVASDFGRIRRDCWQEVQDAFDRLAAEFDLIILEGAGSAAEINLRDYDIVNMRMAQYAKAPVLLVGDIDRGGVLAALVGTMALLLPEESHHVKGFLINKFRGDRKLLEPGIQMVEERMRLPCLGLLPYWRELRVPEEDALNWEALARGHSGRADALTIGVTDVPCISNFTDFEALAREPDVELVRVTGMIATPLDALIFPGTKNTAQALRYVKGRAIDQVARRVHAEGGTVLGLCGGYQMLGRRIVDTARIESPETEMQGLGLLDVETSFSREKITIQVTGVHRETGSRIEGYEVHMGRTTVGNGMIPLFDIQTIDESVTRTEGAVSADGRILGTYVHGIFDSASFRRAFLNRLRQRRGWAPLVSPAGTSLDQDLDHWADFVDEHVDVTKIRSIIEQGLSKYNVITLLSS